MIWRRHYRSMYEGSMVGAGAVAFAVMGYVITHQEHDRQRGCWVVRLNPILLGHILGEEPGDVSKAILFLSGPDENSTSKLEEGRRLVPLVENSMEYRVVNGHTYQQMRDYDDRLVQNREAQARWRKKQRSTERHRQGEKKYCEKAVKDGIPAADAEFDREQEAGRV